jgi:hypothetical protein
MKFEWAFGEVILLAFLLYELWSLRQYKRKHPEAEKTEDNNDPRT